jgi:uncharacterized protein
MLELLRDAATTTETPHARARHALGKPLVAPFASVLGDPRLWAPQRRYVSRAFGAGLAICFVPLPIHLPLAALTGIVARVNLPTIFASIFIVNPLTVVPVYYLAYRVGSWVSGFQAQPFEFTLSWDWLQHGLGPLWQPFLVGCLVCAIGFGLLGWLTVQVAWRIAVARRVQDRRRRRTAQPAVG